MKLFRNKKLLKMMLILTLVFLMIGCDQNHDINEEEILETAIQKVANAGNYESHVKSLSDGYTTEFDDKLAFDDQYCYYVSYDNSPENPIILIEKFSLSSAQVLSLSVTSGNCIVENYNVVSIQENSTMPLEELKDYYSDGISSSFYELSSEENEGNVIITIVCIDLDGANEKIKQADTSQSIYKLLRNEFIITISPDYYISEVKRNSSVQYLESDKVYNTETITTYKNIGKTNLYKAKIDQYLEQAEKGVINEGSVIEYPLS